MAPKSHTWSGRESRLNHTTSHPTRPSFSKLLHLPNNLKDFAQKVVQPFGGFFRHNSTTSAPIARSTSYECSEALEEDYLITPTTAEVREEPHFYSAEPVSPWPPVARSTDEPIDRYHSFPEPRFSDERQRSSWVHTAIRKARHQLLEMWRVDDQKTLLRRKPVGDGERQRWRHGAELGIMVERGWDRESEWGGVPRIPELSISSGIGFQLAT